MVLGKVRAVMGLSQLLTKKYKLVRMGMGRDGGGGGGGGVQRGTSWCVWVWEGLHWMRGDSSSGRRKRDNWHLGDGVGGISGAQRVLNVFQAT